MTRRAAPDSWPPAATDAGGGRCVAIVSVVSVVLLVCSASAVRAQNGPAQAPTADALAQRRDAWTFRAVIEMVRVPVVVVDFDGSFVGGLERADFRVEDGGSLQPVEHFVSEHEPTSVAVVLDGGAASAPIVDGLRNATTTLRSLLRPEDEVAVIRAGRRPETLVAFTSDAEAIGEGVVGFDSEATAGPALYDAILQGIGMLREARFDKRTLIVFGISADAGSGADLEAVKDAAQRHGVTVHGVWIGTRRLGADVDAARAQSIAARPQEADSAGRAAVVELVRFTGGLLARRPGIEHRFGGLRGWMVKACDDISRYVNHQYLLHYTPRRPPEPGTWRDIRVRVSVPFEEVRARSGYVR